MPWIQFYDLPEMQQRRLRAELPDPDKYEFFISPSTGMLARASLRNNELICRQTPPAAPPPVRSKGDFSDWRSAPSFHLNREG